MNWILGVLCLLITPGCAWFQGRALPPSDPPLIVLVGPVILEAPVTSPSDLYTFQKRPSPEVATQLLAQLIEEVEVTGQRLLTDHLARQAGFSVVPFAEARRLQANQSSAAHPFDPEDLRALGREAQADVVITVNTDELCPQITDIECPLFTGLPVR